MNTMNAESRPSALARPAAERILVSLPAVASLGIAFGPWTMAGSLANVPVHGWALYDLGERSLVFDALLLGWCCSAVSGAVRGQRIGSRALVAHLALSGLVWLYPAWHLMLGHNGLSGDHRLFAAYGLLLCGLLVGLRLVRGVLGPSHGTAASAVPQAERATHLT